MFLERRKVLVDVAVDAEVDDFEAGAFHHHRSQVLADVVDVALDGADHDLADRFGAGLGQERTEQFHSGLHRVRGEQDFGDEEDAVAEVDADDRHALHERIVEDPVGAPSPVEQERGALDDLIGEAVVQVVVHLVDQLVVRQRREIDIVTVVVTHNAPTENSVAEVPTYGMYSVWWKRNRPMSARHARLPGATVGQAVVTDGRWRPDRRAEMRPAASTTAFAVTAAVPGAGNR